MIEFLAAKGANVNDQGLEGTTPLYLAWNPRHSEAAAALRRHGAKDEKADRDLPEQFFRAIQTNDGATVKELLLEGVDPNGLGFYCRLLGHCTPLAAASEMGAIESADALLQAGADINAMNSNGLSAVHYAAYWDRIEMLKYLLDRERTLTRLIPVAAHLFIWLFLKRIGTITERSSNAC